MRAEGRALTSDALLEKRGEVIGDESGNTNKDPDASEKALPKGEG
jgi:hypothetical protein